MLDFFRSTLEISNFSSSTIKTASTPGAFAINNASTGTGNVTFTIGAAGDIDGSQDDEWTMNNNKVLTNTQDGTQ